MFLTSEGLALAILSSAICQELLVGSKFGHVLTVSPSVY